MFHDSRGEPVVIRTDPGLVCACCKFDNTPLPGDGAPERCEGCGARL